MLSRLIFLASLLCLSAALHAQPEPPSRFQIYGGYSYLSNSLNGLPGGHHALSGFDAAFAFPSWHRVRFKVDASGYHGTNLGASQGPYFILGGAQYNILVRRETIFVEGLGGVGGANKDWAYGQADGQKAGTVGETASFAALVGGGLDTRITRHAAFRVEGDFQYSYFSFEGLSLIPYRVPGLPTNFGRVTGGMVWNF
jgi:hypothetical protein